MYCLSLAALQTTLAITLMGLTGCMTSPRAELLRQTGGNAALFAQFAAFDARTGNRVTFAQLDDRCAAADVILFGEEHSDVVCNALEAQLLTALSQRMRPITLAMEFFEADTQAALDAYLSGRLDEAKFRALTRQKRAYVTAHRPLIEFCRSAAIPVLAANAPWRLTRALRVSGQSFDEFRATTQPADRALLPRASTMLSGPYRDRFVDAMREHEMPPTSQAASQPGNSHAASQPTSQPDRAEQILRAYRAQSLWDDAMAESVANHRNRFPDRRVLLVVGKFHVADDGGTRFKIRGHRPGDHMLTVIYHGTSAPPLKFDGADRGAGDIVIYGVRPPEEEEAPSKK